MSKKSSVQIAHTYLLHLLYGTLLLSPTSKLQTPPDWSKFSGFFSRTDYRVKKNFVDLLLWQRLLVLSQNIFPASFVFTPLLYLHRLPCLGCRLWALCFCLLAQRRGHRRFIDDGSDMEDSTAQKVLPPPSHLPLLHNNSKSRLKTRQDTPTTDSSPTHPQRIRRSSVGRVGVQPNYNDESESSEVGLRPYQMSSLNFECIFPPHCPRMMSPTTRKSQRVTNVKVVKP